MLVPFLLNISYFSTYSALCVAQHSAAYGLTEQSEDNNDNNAPEQEQPDESQGDTDPGNKHHAERREKRKAK